MKKIITLKTALFCLILIFMQTQPIQAQWSNDPDVNTCLVNLDRDQDMNCIVNDGLGNFIIGWHDNRFSSDNQFLNGLIYAQKLNPDGVIQWTDNGIRVNIDENSDGHSYPEIIKSENGKAIFVWRKFAGSFQTNTYAGKTDENGNRVWGDVNVFNKSILSLPVITPDHSNGVVITTFEQLGWTYRSDIIAQRINSEGERKWGYQGIYICDADEDQKISRVVVNAGGDAFFVWQDKRTDTNGDIYAQRVDSSGIIKWDNNGIVVCNNPNTQDIPLFINDNNSGIIAAWYGQNTEGDWGTYMQRIDKDGNMLWGNDGILLIANSILNEIVSDGNGGAIVISTTYTGQKYNIYAQRINEDGVKQWPSGGVFIGGSSAQISSVVATADGAGGVITAWTDAGNGAGTDNIYAQRVSLSGTILWQAGGVAITTAPDKQGYPSIASDGDEGAIITWDDYRNGFVNSDIYVQKIDKNGNLGGVPSLIHPDTEVSSPVSIYPNPVKDNLYLKLNRAEKSRIAIRLFSVDGSLIKEAQYKNRSTFNIPLTDINKGIYIIEVKGENINYRTKFVKQ